MTSDESIKAEISGSEASSSANDGPATQTESESESDPLDALWASVLGAWNEPKMHSAFLQYAITASRLPEAAKRYRALKDDPEKAAEVKKRLDGITAAAMQLLMSSATPRSTSGRVPRWLTALTALVAVVVIFYLARLLLGRR